MNSCDTRFFKANQLIIEVEKIIEKKVICSVVEAEIFWATNTLGFNGSLSMQCQYIS